MTLPAYAPRPGSPIEGDDSRLYGLYLSLRTYALTVPSIFKPFRGIRHRRLTSYYESEPESLVRTEPNGSREKCYSERQEPDHHRHLTPPGLERVASNGNQHHHPGPLGPTHDLTLGRDSHSTTSIDTGRLATPWPLTPLSRTNGRFRRDASAHHSTTKVKGRRKETPATAAAEHRGQRSTTSPEQGRQPIPFSATVLLLLSLAFLQFDYTGCCSRRAQLKARAPLGFNITEALLDPARHRLPPTYPPIVTPHTHPDGDVTSVATSIDRPVELKSSLPNIAPAGVANKNVSGRVCNNSTVLVVCGPYADCKKGACQCLQNFHGPNCDYSRPSTLEVSVSKASVTSGIIVAILFAFTIIFILYLFLQRKKRSLHLKSTLAVREIAAMNAPPAYDLHGDESNLSSNAYEMNPQHVTMGSTPDIYRAQFYDVNPTPLSPGRGGGGPDTAVPISAGLAPGLRRESSLPFRHLEPFKATFEELLNSIALVSYKSGHLIKSHVSASLRGRSRSRGSLSGRRESRRSSQRPTHEIDHTLFPLTTTEERPISSPFQHRYSAFLTESSRPEPNFD